MGIGDIGLFTPAESAYSKPGMFEESLRAEAVKRGTWLASLDQFYAQLSEAQRQFNVTSAFKEKELASSERLHGAELEYKYKALSTEEALSSRALDIKEKEALSKEGTNFLGRTLKEKSLDYLKNWSSGGGDTSWMIGGAGDSTNRFLDYTNGKLVPSTGISPPSSGEIEWDLY